MTGAEASSLISRRSAPARIGNPLRTSSHTTRRVAVRVVGQGEALRTTDEQQRQPPIAVLGGHADPPRPIRMSTMHTSRIRYDGLGLVRRLSFACPWSCEVGTAKIALPGTLNGHRRGVAELSKD
jgi:hypothetical protein